MSVKRDVDNRSAPANNHGGSRPQAADILDERITTVEDFVTVATYFSMSEAEPARLALDAAGIPAFATDEDVGSLLVPTMVGGIKLQVPAADAARAEQVLAELQTESQPPPAPAPMTKESRSIAQAATPRSGSLPTAAGTWRNVPSAGILLTCRIALNKSPRPAP